MADLILESQNLVKHFDEVQAVKGVSFDIKKGEIFSLLGPNGAGKTTTISMLSCLLKPTDGDDGDLYHVQCFGRRFFAAVGTRTGHSAPLAGDAFEQRYAHDWKTNRYLYCWCNSDIHFDSGWSISVWR